MSIQSISQVPQVHRWMKDEFYRMLEEGYFLDRRVELIEGEIVDMPSQLNFHAAGLKLVERALEKVFGVGYWVRPQNTLDLDQHTVVDPDIAVIEGDPEQVLRANPTTALLVVEISETTLNYDRGRKAELYARADIKDYWVLNLVDQYLEVFRQPTPDANSRTGFSYADHVILTRSDTISPLAAPTATIAVTKLIPALGHP